MVLTTFVIWQYRSDILMQQSIQEEALRLEAIAIALAETRQEALGADELAVLREQLDLQLNTNAERLDLLEQRPGASARVISASTVSVAFLQGTYGLRRLESGQLMRPAYSGVRKREDCTTKTTISGTATVITPTTISS